MTAKKLEQYEEARRLRRDDGLSIKTIARQLGVAQSSVSTWVRDIELTEAQITRIKSMMGWPRGQTSKSVNQRAYYQTIATRARERRQQQQEAGRLLAHQNDGEFKAGCMLYWAEGDKSRNCLGLVNSDPELLRFFYSFLQRYFGPSLPVKVQINCYLNNGLSQTDIENYWLKLFGLSRDSLHKTMVNIPHSASKKLKVGKLPYGTVHLRLSRVELVQKIYRAIQEIAHFNREGWLF